MPSDTPPVRPARWVEVHTSALQANLAAAGARLKPNARVIAVVKANGYGHGTALAARAFADAGAELLAVTTLEEAGEVRAAGVTTPILLFAPSIAEDVPILLDQRLIATVCGFEQALALSQQARELGGVLPVHLKVDTGMGRVGCLWTDAAVLAETLHNDPHLAFEGMYTHFATANEPNSSLFREQRDLFATLLETLAATGCRPPLAHAANSAAFLADPATHHDAVRLGTLLYGQFPPGVPHGDLSLAETWRLCCRILQVKDLPAGWTVGYGAEFICSRATRIAVLPVGYTDGLTVEPGSVFRGKRGLRRWVGESVLKRAAPYATIHGKRAPFVGRVAAQMVCVDVTDIPEASAEDVARLSARRTLVNASVPRVAV